MRFDQESGKQRASTLGEYRNLCRMIGSTIGLPYNAAVKLLDEKITEAAEGANTLVVTSDSQMQALLLPLVQVHVPFNYSKLDLTKPIVAARMASDAMLDTALEGYSCLICSEPLQVTEQGRGVIRNNQGQTLCNYCSACVITEHAKKGLSMEVVTSREAEKQWSKAEMR